MNRYWKLSNFGEAHEPRTEGYRCTLEHFGVEPPHCIPGHHANALMYGQVITDWERPMVVKCDAPGPLEDFPWTDEHVASERLRVLFELHAPRCAQFLPLTIVQYDGVPTTIQYWLVNWLHTVDFYDRQHTDAMHTPEGTSFFQVVVDSSKIPHNMPICRMKHFERFIVIREDIKKVIEESGITGCQFYTVKMLEDVLDKTKSPRKDNRKGT